MTTVLFYFFYPHACRILVAALNRLQLRQALLSTLVLLLELFELFLNPLVAGRLALEVPLLCSRDFLDLDCAMVSKGETKGRMKVLPWQHWFRTWTNGSLCRPTAVL